MFQSDPRTTLGSCTITVSKAGAKNSAQRSVQHIAKAESADKTPNEILVTDLDMTKFIALLVTEIDFRLDSDQIEYQLPYEDTIMILALQEEIWQTTIDRMYNQLSQLNRAELHFIVRPIETASEGTILYPIAEVRGGYSRRDGFYDEQQNLNDAPRSVKGWKWALVLSAILSSLFLFALDNTIVADIQPAIIETFEDVGGLTWLGVAFLLGSASTNLIWAKAYGKFNTKWTYIFSLLLFEAGSALCGAAKNMSTFIVGRTICGVGGVGMYIGVMTLLSLTTSIHERPKYLASTGIVLGIGTVLGPVVGGEFAGSTATWRWAFYINLCLGGGFAPVYCLLLPPIDPQRGKQFSERIREMDILGGMLIIGAFVSGVMAISFGGILYSWNSAQIIGCFVVSGLLFILFGTQQTYSFFTTVKQRIFPVEFLESRTMVLLFCAMSCASTGLFIPIYMVPLFFQFTRSDTSLDAAVRLLPFIFISVFACLVNGVVMSTYGHYMPWYLAAGVFTASGAALMFVVNENTSIPQIYGSTALLGLGVGLVLQASFSVAQAIVPVEKISDAVGFITCAQVSSLTISLAIANTVFLNEAQNRIRSLLPNLPLSSIQGAIAGVGSRFVVSLPLEIRQLVLKGIVQSMSNVYILGITAGVFLILLSLGLKRERLFMSVGGFA